MVRGLLAVQSQDYPGAKWGVAQRVADGVLESELDALFDAGAILRTHVMRPTWHFVAPEDLRWMLALTAPRVHQASAYQYRLLGIDDISAGRAAEVIVRALEGGRALTRDELGVALREAGIEATGIKLAYLVSHAELQAIVVSGPRKGRRQTYALVDERVPPARIRSREEALAELARRYVEGHGPAQAQDLSWWSGLTIRDARLALQLASPPLVTETHGERTFWVAPGRHASGRAAGSLGTPTIAGPAVQLLPNYDELLIAFRDRTDAMDPGLPPPARVASEILAHVAVRDGLVVGGWRRSEERGAVKVELSLLVPFDPAERAALVAAIDRFSRFLGRAVEVTGLD